jgi:hypothetical protein
VGNLQASAFADEVATGNCSIDQALTWHLTANHYPPLPLSILPVCKRAIEKANRGQWDAKVRLPEGVSYRGAKLAPVWAVVEQHHLDAFVERNGE